MLMEAAKRYIERGWSVVPIPPRSKGPTIKGWPELRITDPSGLFADGGNIGIILGQASGIVCVDLDHPLAVELGPHFLPPTDAVAGRSENPRSHWFYRPTTPVESCKLKLPKDKSDPKKKLSVVEILSDGNQVVVGPSIHETGDLYDIVEGEPAEIDGEQLTQAVRSLFSAVLDTLGLKPTPKPPEKVNGYHGEGLSPATDYDERGDVRSLLVKHGWVPGVVVGDNEHWRRPGKSWGTSATLKDCKLFYVFTSSTELEADRCYGPFGLFAALECGGNFGEAAKVLREQGYGEQLASVDLSAITSPVREADYDEPEISNSTDGSEFPVECLNVGGLLGMVIDFTLRTSLYQQPELALGGAIALLGAITGRKITDTFGTRSNVYVLGLGLSGVGKEQARRVNKELLLRSGGERMIGSERIGSHAGIVTTIHDNPSSLMQLDEMGRLLETMKDPRKSPHLFNCITVFMQLYSSSSTIWKADAYADAKKVKTIDQPHLCIYGTATPDSFWNSLSTDNIAEGLIGRLLVFEGRGYELEMQDPGEFQPEAELLEAIRYWNGFHPGGNLSVEHPKPLKIEHTPEARERFTGHIHGINLRRRDEVPLRAAVWSRSGEKVAKLALIHACSRTRIEPSSITLEDVEWGIRLGNWLTRRLLIGCGEHVAENEVEAKAKRILSMLSGKGLTKNELTRKTQWIKSREREEILRDLINCDLVEVELIETGSRKKTVLRKRQRNVKETSIRH